MNREKKSEVSIPDPWGRRWWSDRPWWNVLPGIKKDFGSVLTSLNSLIFQHGTLLSHLCCTLLSILAVTGVHDSLKVHGTSALRPYLQMVAI